MKDERVKFGLTVLMVCLGCLFLLRQMDGGVRSTRDDLCRGHSFPELCALLNMGALSAAPRPAGSTPGDGDDLPPPSPVRPPPDRPPAPPKCMDREGPNTEGGSDSHSSSGGGGRHLQQPNDGGGTTSNGPGTADPDGYRVDREPQDPPPLPALPLWSLDLRYAPAPCPNLYSFAPWATWPKEDCRPQKPPPPSQEPEATMPRDFTPYEALRICWPAKGERLGCLRAVWGH